MKKEKEQEDIKGGRYKLKKDQVIKELQECTGLAKHQVIEFFEQYANIVKEGLEQCDKVPFPELGTFKMKTKAARAEREARNPRTGEKVFVPAKPAYLTPVFVPGKQMRETLEVEVD